MVSDLPLLVVQYETFTVSRLKVDRNPTKRVKWKGNEVECAAQ